VSTVPKLIHLQRRKYSFIHGDGYIISTGTQHPLDEGYQKRSRTTQEDSIGNAKHNKEDNNWLHPTTTHNHHAALSDDENIDHLQRVATDSTPKPPPIFVSDVITIQPLLQLLDQIVKQSYEIKTLAGNHIRIQPKTPDLYRAIIKALAEKKHGIPYLQT
jgi:hypothetical protein